MQADASVRALIIIGMQNLLKIACLLLHCLLPFSLKVKIMSSKPGDFHRKFWGKVTDSKRVPHCLAWWLTGKWTAFTAWAESVAENTTSTRMKVKIVSTAHALTTSIPVFSLFAAPMAALKPFPLICRTVQSDSTPICLFMGLQHGDG